MKKKYIVAIVVAVLIVLAEIGFAIYKNTKNNERNYEIAQINNYNYFVLNQEEKYGVIDKEGKIVIPAKYSQIKIPNPEKDIFFCYNGENSEVLNNKGEKIYTEFASVEPIKLSNVISDLIYEKTVLKYEENGKFGLIDFNGKKIVNNIYENIEGLPNKEGELIAKKEGKTGIINIKGAILVDFKYDGITIDNYYQEEGKYKNAGYIVSNTTTEGYRYGYVNVEGKEIIPVEYNELSRITEIQEESTPYFILAKNGQYGVIKNQEKIINNEYQSIRYENENKVFVLEKSKKYGVSSIDGNIVVPLEYDQIDITGKYLYAKKGESVKVLDKQGKEAQVKANESYLQTPNEKYQIKIINSEDGISYGVVNQSEQEIIPQNYNYIEYLYDNYFIACSKDGKLGVINDKKEEKIPFKYETLQKIENCKIIKAIAPTDKVTQIYSSKMEKICELKNATLKQEEQYLKIFNDDELKYVDTVSEKEVSNTEVYKNNNLFTKQENNKWGYCDNSGNIKVEPQYEKVTEFNKYGFAGIKQDGKWGVINNKGEIVLKPTYTIKTSDEPYFIGEYYQIQYGYGEKYYSNKIL